MTSNSRDARIYTNFGWVKACDLQEGMKVLTPQGTLVPVVKTWKQRSRNLKIIPLRGLPFICDATEALPMTGFACHEQRNYSIDTFDDYMMISASHLFKSSLSQRRSFFLSRGLLGKGHEHHIKIEDSKKIIYAVQKEGFKTILAVRLIVILPTVEQMDNLHFSLRTQGFISWMHTRVPTLQGGEFVCYGNSSLVGKKALCLEVIGDFSRFLPEDNGNFMLCKEPLNIASKDKTPVKRIQEAGSTIMFCFKTQEPCLYLSDGLFIRRS